jgi:hypothetical protein
MAKAEKEFQDAWQSEADAVPGGGVRCGNTLGNIVLICEELAAAMPGMRPA